ncbi:MAG TPA: hypothetical protein VLV50_05630 [Stellaceae bacterium]|nr:hypothetical protein [Stellaceae bacterium]
MSKWLASAALAFVFLLPVVPAQADPYDGRWVIDFPATTVTAAATSTKSCAALRIAAEIKDSRISGELHREVTSPTEVTSGAGPGSSPLAGTVAADGTITATWQGYTIGGKLAGNGGSISVTGECGPRTGQAIRIQN